MQNYLQIAAALSRQFQEFKLTQIGREDNKQADALANLGSSSQASESRSIPVIYLQFPATTKDLESVHTNSLTWDWRSPILKFLLEGALPADKKEARRTRVRAARFCVYNGKLYKKSFGGPLLRCVGPSEATYVLREIHEGDCGDHAGYRSLVRKVLRAGYYWPTLQKDAQVIVKKCDKCQRHANLSHLHPEELHAIVPSWPFMKWGMDIVGKLPPAPGRVVYMLALTDYFTKWIEAGSFAQVQESEVIDFVWKSVVCRFGLPKEIVCDNGSQFIGRRFRNFCAKWKIKLNFSTPRNPQSNGQAESSNKTIMSSLKKRLDKAKGRWAEELPAVLWAYRTTPRAPTGETPFSLVYGAEAMIPVEAGTSTMRRDLADEETSNQALTEDLDLLDERREQALIRMASYQQKLSSYYNKHVRIRQFSVGDWVLRRVFQNTKEAKDGKLGPTYEGPYQITGVGGQGSYSLQDAKGRPVKRCWNAIHLKRYYF